MENQQQIIEEDVDFPQEAKPQVPSGSESLDMAAFGSKKFSGEKPVLPGPTRIAIIDLQYKKSSKEETDKIGEKYFGAWAVVTMSYDDGRKRIRENLGGIRLYADGHIYCGESSGFGEFKSLLSKMTKVEDTFDGVKKAAIGMVGMAEPITVKTGKGTTRKNAIVSLEQR